MGPQRRCRVRSRQRYPTKHCGVSAAATQTGSVVSVLRQNRLSLTKRSYVCPPVPSTIAPLEATSPAAWRQLIEVVEGRDCAIALVASINMAAARTTFFMTILGCVEGGLCAGNRKTQSGRGNVDVHQVAMLLEIPRHNNANLHGGAIRAIL
jgi:hypothetical protein